MDINNRETNKHESEKKYDCPTTNCNHLVNKDKLREVRKISEVSINH